MDAIERLGADLASQRGKECAPMSWGPWLSWEQLDRIGAEIAAEVRDALLCERKK